MTKFIASVKDQVTKEVMLITSEEFTTKKAFAEELKGGFTVRFIATEDTFDAECEKFYAKQERAREMAKIRREAKKETARMMEEAKVNAQAKIEAEKAETVETTEVSEVVESELVVAVKEALTKSTDVKVELDNKSDYAYIRIGQTSIETTFNAYGRDIFIIEDAIAEAIDRMVITGG